MTDRILPHDNEAEQAVIGGVLLNNEALQHDLPPDDFYASKHQKIWAHMLALEKQQEAIDVVTVNSMARANGGLGKVGGGAYVASLTNAVPTIGHVEKYAAIVKTNAKLRRIILASRSMALQAYGKNDPLEIMATFDEEMTNDMQTSHAHKVGDIVSSRIDHYEKLASGEVLPYINNGFSDLMHKCPMVPTDFVVIGARPGMGKTALGLCIALESAKNGHATLFHSLEMPRDQIMDRLISLVSGVEFEKTRTGKFDWDKDASKVSRAMGIIDKLPLFIDARQSLSSQEIKASVASHKRKNGVQIVVVDYIQIMKEKGRFGARHEEIALSTKGLKSVATKFDVVMIALAQLKQTVDQREPPRPHEGDIEGSNEPQKAADSLLLIYRQDVYQERLQELENKKSSNKGKYLDPTLEGVAQLAIAKSRHASPGAARLLFHGKTMKFTNLEGRWDV